VQFRAFRHVHALMRNYVHVYVAINCSCSAFYVAYFTKALSAPDPMLNSFKRNIHSVCQQPHISHMLHMSQIY